MSSYFKIFILISVLQYAYGTISEPYEILGIPRTASQSDVKRAFKKLAREWHPDKNSAPDASEKFVEISDAYKLLSDPERRRFYDTTGQTEKPSGFHRYHDARDKRFDPFDDLFSSFGAGSGFRFHNEEGINYYAKRTITKRTYEKVVIPRSWKQPYVLMFFSDWCVACAHIEPIWRRLVEELEPINFAMNTVHAGAERELCRKLGVSTVPYMILVLDGHPYHYTQPSLSMASSLDFIKSKFTRHLVQKITDSTLDDFLNGWRDNKVRALLFGRLDMIRLRYYTVALEFRDRVLVGYVQTDGNVGTNSISKRFGVSTNVDTLLVFHEDPENPVASVAMADLPYQTIRDILEANKFLLLPRLSSQTVFDSLCPVEPLPSRRLLCVVLITRDCEEHDANRASLRNFALSNSFPAKDKFRFTYIFREKQGNFLYSLTEGQGTPEASDLHIVVIWRRDKNRLSYDWVPESWKVEEDQQNKSKEALRQTLNKIVYAGEPMAFEAQIQELFDEHAQGLLWRVMTRLTHLFENMREKVTSDDLIPAVSVLATILFILVSGYVMSYLVKLEEDRVKAAMKSGEFGSSSSKNSQKELKIHELRGETYNGLVRLLKPGCRTIVLLCDVETKEKFMAKFHKSVWPFRRNKTLMFAFLILDRPSAQKWYKEILELSLSEQRDLNINPKNIVGTVISLNGHRKYFCIYHAKHPEITRKSGALPSYSSEVPAGLRRRNRVGDNAELLGEDGSESESDHDVEVGSKKKDNLNADSSLLNYYSDILFEDQLLDGLSNWLDRLFEGSTHRYHINYWPDWPGK